MPPTFRLMGLPSFADSMYVEKMQTRARELSSDGCSGPALQIYVLACLEHDIHYRTHMTLYGRWLTQSIADRILKDRIQELAILGRFSPSALWRYLALKWFGHNAWNDSRRGSPLHERPILYWWASNKDKGDTFPMD